MLAQKLRLGKKSDFESVFKSGNKAYDHYYIFRYRENGLAHCRFAVIVSNKISKKAVVRNKLRRRIKAVISSNLPKFKQNIDLVITVLSPAAEIDFKQTNQILNNKFEKLKFV